MLSLNRSGAGLNSNAIQTIKLSVEGLEQRALLTTGTGLDQLVDIIVSDPGLNQRIPTSEIRAGADAADGMNQIIVETIRATGLANDGIIQTSDVRDFNSYIRSKFQTQWTVLHGDDENGVETGFHLVQNDGATTRLFARNAVNTVADGLYHLGFGISGNRLLNEDGDANARVETVAFWLNSLLGVDLANGNLRNPNVNPYTMGSTGTGLDRLVTIITKDMGLERNIPTSEIMKGAKASDGMNAIIVEAIRATGIANDGTINPADVRDLNSYIRQNHLERWNELHGNDEGNVETGFHLVQADGATSRLFARNAVNTVADGLYHLGFEIKCDRFVNEDGDANASVDSVAYWLEELLEADLANGTLRNPAVDPYARGTTGTGLDHLVNIIAADAGLNRRISTSEITAGARAADEMNKIILQAIRVTGVANDGDLTVADVRVINLYIRANQLANWTRLHGNDEGKFETGFHLVQDDGATSRLYGKNAVNTVADGIYHLGFKIVNNRFVNEDGNANASVEQVTVWLNSLLRQDLANGRLRS